MKKLLAFIFAVSIALSIPASASGRIYEIEAPAGYIYADIDESKTQLAQFFDMTEAQLDSYFSDNSIIYLAVGKKKTEQICIIEAKTDFSTNAVSFSRMTEAELLEIGRQLAGSSFSADGIVAGKNGTSFLKLTLLDSSDAVVREYITVCSGKLYTLRITSAENIDNISDTVAKSTSITDYAVGSKSSAGNAYTLLAAAGIAIFSAIAIYLGYTVIRDIRARHKPQAE